ncbi:xanthine dehydrogenase [Bacillus cereus]|uniref:Xanthine dehydrogenase n=1 Tax=Bacillus cereus TaxID=1396 RepID=A0A9X6U5L0_BACCE|nr:FAD binding domain-containing protein [Bacillus cereus]PEN78895.1 xanthine dehydrogenase [Bacillus cereus]
MIPFDFEYYCPSSIHDATKLFYDLDKEGKNPLYYGGGTEIITLSRLQQLSGQSMIDLKKIPECNVLEFHQNNLILGATLSLTKISESCSFPLLGNTVAMIADHTARNKITLGGNLAGKIIYKEAILPLLLADSTVVIGDINGIRQAPISQLFKEQLQLKKGEFIAQILTDENYTELPFCSVKRRKLERIDYPLITVAALKKDDCIQVAFSGLCPFPFRSSIMEAELNNKNIDIYERIDRALSHIPAPILNDIRGSQNYRIFTLKNMLYDALTELR